MSYKQNHEREEKLSREECPVCGGPILKKRPLMLMELPMN